MYRFILIDDEALIRKGTLKKLEPLADRITCVGEAGNGEEAIAMIKKEHPDFVITDMQMPVMHGMDLLPYLSEHYPEIALIVISGFRNFDYIKQAISSNAVEYLLKPFSAEEIQKTVKSILDQFDSKTAITQQIQSSEEEKEQSLYDYDLTTLNNLIFGYHTSLSGLRSKKLNRINKTHSLILLSINYIHGRPREDMAEWLSENGFGELALYLSSDSMDQGFMILFLPHQNVLSIQKLIQQILEALYSRSDFAEVHPLIGISTVHHSLSELNDAYQETTAAIDSRLIGAEEDKALWFEGQTEPVAFSWDRQDEFLFRVEAGMTEETAILMDELFQLYENTAGLRLTDVKAHLYTLTEQARQILRHYIKITESSNRERSVLSVMTHMFTLDELHRYFEQFFTNIARMLQTKSVYAIGDTVEKVQTYIRHNYQKNLTQDFIASLFYLNRSYLSTVFRKKTGKKFIDFLNDVRIEAAESLLEKSDQKMALIASAVGYDNVKYFFRVFKKRTGLTPEQYRTKLRT